MENKNNKGFTLVELLVVIAIIGILAVVAVPALFKNIEKGKIADLEADISAIRSAALSYYSDKSEYPVDMDTRSKIPVSLIKDEEIDVNDHRRQGTLDLLSQIEGLSYPFGGVYKLTAENGIDIPQSPDTMYIKIIPARGKEIGIGGKDKLQKDLSLTDHQKNNLIIPIIKN